MSRRPSVGDPDRPLLGARPLGSASLRPGGLRRLLALFAGVLAIAMIPLGLSGPTAWLLIPVHLGFSGITATGALLEGLAGYAERARRWGLLFVVCTALAVAALELGAQIRGSGAGYWGAPWIFMLLWGWIPVVIAGFSGMIGESRRRRLNRGALRRRQRP